jgi:arsenate reductase (thioredoxin)
MTTGSPDPMSPHILTRSAQRLEREFEGVFAVETIARFMSEARSELETRATVSNWVPILVERFTRDRLKALTRLAGQAATDRPAVLFLCVHNAGRSQMAAGWMRRLAGDRVDVFSGGSEPGSEVNPMAVAVMAEVGIDIAAEFPKPWSDEEVRAADVVVTMGCGDECPYIPGRRYLDWDLPSPEGRPLEEVRGTREEIERRVVELVDELND